MDIGREVRRYRAEPVISPVPGAEQPPVEQSPVEQPAVAEPAAAQPAEQATVTTPDVDRGGVTLPG